MRLTIVVPDDVVGIDGQFYHIDLAGKVPNNLHALQWYGDHGEEEHIVDGVPQSQRIESLDAYQEVIRVWHDTHAAATAPALSTLEDAQAAAIAAIDAAAGAARARYITVTAGQDATYLAKAAQAEAYAAAGYPADLTTYGYIEAELARLGLDPAQASDRRAACDGILAIRAQWLAIDALIERHRLVGKARVQAAADHAAVAAERDAAVAALDAI